MSCSYDLVGALKASRGGIDNYYSKEDDVLINAEDYMGTADGRRTATAGRVGFAVPRRPHGPAFPPPPQKVEPPMGEKAPKGPGDKKGFKKDGMKEGKKDFLDLPPHPDAALYCNLRQLCWNDELPHGFGHGNHSTFIGPECMIRHVFPLFGYGPANDGKPR